MEHPRKPAASTWSHMINAPCFVCLQRAQSELAAHQKKILHVDNHIGISIAGLTADARLLW